jgi:hypothetical protein
MMDEEDEEGLVVRAGSVFMISKQALNSARRINFVYGVNRPDGHVFFPLSHVWRELEIGLSCKCRILRLCLSLACL